MDFGSTPEFYTMVLQMARPTKNAKTGVYYFRQKTPADLVAIVGKKEVGWSLGTKDPEQAKALNALAVQKQAKVWERYRKLPEPIPHAKIVALCGILYRDYMAALELEPGEAAIWEKALALLDKAGATPEGLEQWYGAEADSFAPRTWSRSTASYAFASRRKQGRSRPATTASPRCTLS